MSEIILSLKGTITSRPGEDGPTRETNVLELNPSREKLILNKTKWETLYPGTLNVKLEKKDINEIEQLEPFFKEKPVEYPKPYENIPKKKGSYLYYKGMIADIEVLIRTTQLGNSTTIGIVAPIRLKTFLNINDNEMIDFKIGSTKKIIRPLFFDKDKNQIRLDNLYKDAHVFLVSSGPSFKDFPHKNKLRLVQTMCINNSAKALMPYTRPNMWACVDDPNKFLYTLWNDPQTLKLVPESHPNKILWNSDINLPDEKKVKDCPNVVYWRRNNVFNKKTYLTEDSINWGNNKEYIADNGVNGKRSVFIATIKILYALGFRHVYLLGVDFNMDKDKPQYSFEQQKSKSGISGNNSSYQQMDYWFNELQPIFLENKFYIHNLNKDSKLTAFPYMDFDEAFEQALGFVHDTQKYINGDLENPRNLYETRVWKCSSCNHWQRIAEKKQKDDNNKEYHISVSGCSKCGKILSTKDKERKG